MRLGNKMFNNYKDNVIGCLVLLEKHSFSPVAQEEFKIGLDAIEKPEHFYEKDALWLHDLVLDFVENGEIKIEKWVSCEVVEEYDQQFSRIDSINELIKFIESIVFQGDIDAIREDKWDEAFDLYQYCISIIRQFEYLKRKKLNNKNISNTRMILDGFLYDISTFYIDEYEWLKNLCTQFFENGKANIDYDGVPEGIVEFDKSYLRLQSFDDVIFLLRSIKIDGEEDNVGEFMDSTEELDDEE